MAVPLPPGSQAATGAATSDFLTKLIGAAEIGAGTALILLGLSLLSGFGKAAVKTGVRVAKVIR
jgi:hypothetical protein